jgi:hypothetical protein
MMVHWFCCWEDDGTDPASQANEARRLGVDAWMFELCWHPGQAMAIPAAMRWLAAQEKPAIGYGLQWQPARPLSPGDERQAMQALLPWLHNPAAELPLGRAVLVLAELNLLSSTRWALPRIRQSLKLGSQSLGNPLPLLLALSDPLGERAINALDGTLARSNPVGSCQRVGTRWNYESFLANAHWHRPVQSTEQQSVRALGVEEETGYLHATAHAYQEWLMQSQAWTSLAHMSKPESNWILLESWLGHQRWGPEAAKTGEWKGTKPLDSNALCSATSRPRPKTTERYHWGNPRRDNPALFIHGFHPDILSNIFESIPGKIKGEWTLYLSTSIDHLAVVRELVGNRQWSQAIVIGCENKGRDMAPFLHELLPAALNEGHPWGLKLHTKRSSHLGDGNAWSQQLLQGLTAHQTVEALGHHFDHEPQLGLAAPPGCLVPLSVHLDRNAQWLGTVAETHHLDGKWLVEQMFPAGSMYAFRLKALQPLLEWQARLPPMEAEEGQQDGTWAHAMERLVGASCGRAGMWMTELKGHRAGVPHFAYRQALLTSHIWA